MVVLLPVLQVAMVELVRVMAVVVAVVGAWKHGYLHLQHHILM
jgi:hypothetical protein